MGLGKAAREITGKRKTPADAFVSKKLNTPLPDCSHVFSFFHRVS